MSAILFSIIAYIGGASTWQTRQEDGEKAFTAIMADRIGKRMPIMFLLNSNYLPPADYLGEF
jgi:hypothetical protein